MTYARARLWLGMSGMASLIGLTLLALLLRLPALLPTQPTHFSLELQSLLLVALVYALIQLPFDLFGGYILPHEYGDNPPAFLDFWLKWGRGVAVQSIIFVLAALVLMFVGRSLSFLPFVFTAGLLMFLLVLVQKNVAQWVAGLPLVSHDLTPQAAQLDQWGLNLPDILVVESETRAFTGGIVGLPGSDEVIVPAGWFRDLSPDVLAFHLARRAEAIQAGGRRRGVWVALILNLIGLVLTSILLADRIHLGSVSGVVTIGLGMTVWSFIAIVAMARPTRAAIHTLDRYLGVLGLETSQVETALSALEERQGDEAATTYALLGESYDTPTVPARLAALGESGFGTDRTAWHAGRTLLYLSWVGMGFLGRALPAQLGRPELWALPPVE